jgi:hypothetical protein
MPYLRWFYGRSVQKRPGKRTVEMMHRNARGALLKLIGYQSINLCLTRILNALSQVQTSWFVRRWNPSGGTGGESVLAETLIELAARRVSHDLIARIFRIDQDENFAIAQHIDG